MANELYHHGTKGQKWGVRRYQNPDGSLTPLGRIRYGTPENFRKSYIKSKSKKATRSTKSDNKPSRDIKNMSDEDLKALKDRLSLEKDVVELQKKLTEIPEKEKSKGQQFVEDVMSDSGKKIVTATLTGAGLLGVAKILGDDTINVASTGADIYKSVMRKK